MIAILAFYLFATLTIASAIAVIFARNPVHAVLWLIVAFFNAAGLMLLMGAEFIAMLVVIVYVGAVAVLFLFVVMMLDIDFTQLRSGFNRNLPFGLLIALVLLAEIVIAMSAYRAGPSLAAAAPPAQTVPNIEALGAELYSRYLLPFEAISMLLLVTTVAVVVLAKRNRSARDPKRIAEDLAAARVRTEFSQEVAR